MIRLSIRKTRNELTKLDIRYIADELYYLRGSNKEHYLATWFYSVILNLCATSSHSCACSMVRVRRVK